jgi:hypothetical protein
MNDLNFYFISVLGLRTIKRGSLMEGTGGFIFPSTNSKMHPHSLILFLKKICFLVTIEVPMGYGGTTADTL